MRDATVLRRRWCAGTAVALLVLSGCGGSEDQAAPPPVVPAEASSSVPPAGPPPAASPPAAPPAAALPPDVAPPPATGSSAAPAAGGPAGEPVPTGERSVAQLTGQLRFTAPAEDDPAVAEAVAAYRDFLVQFVVAQGLPDGDWAPLVDRVDPSLVAAGLQPLRESVAANEVTLGSFTERVQEVAGDAQSVFLTSCADASDRDIFDRTTGKVVGPVTPAVVPLKVTMQRSGEQWLLAGYNEAGGDVSCR